MSAGGESSQTLQTLAPVQRYFEPASLTNDTIQTSDRRAASSSAVVAFACTAPTLDAICVPESHREPNALRHSNYNLTRFNSAKRASIRSGLFSCKDNENDVITQLFLRFRTYRSISRR